MAFYLPQDDAGKLAWIINFKTKMPTYATTLGIATATVTQVTTDYTAFNAIMAWLDAVKKYSQSITAYKNQLRDGGKVLGALPVHPTAPAMPAGSKEDIFGRISALVQTIKAHPAYTEAIGNDLWLIADDSMVDPHAWKPILKAELQAGSPNLKWTKGHSSGIKIWVDRGDGKGFSFLATDTIPDYLDKAVLPPVGQSAMWKYQAIYILKDEEVGQMSDVLEVTVAGRNV